MNAELQAVMDRIVRQRKGSLTSLSDRAITDLRQDRLVFGPGSLEDLQWLLMGWPEGAEGTLFDSGVHQVDPRILVGLGPEESLFLPAQTGAIHRGGVQGLADVVERLLDPDGGCPWDLEQTHETLKKYLIEEAYELLEAIDRKDAGLMQEELGDVLLQPMMHAEIARRAGGFSLSEVGQRQAEKLVRRHPHVFGDAVANDAETVLKNWDSIKKAERDGPSSILDGIPAAMPALSRALTVSKRAARAGFEWPDLDGVFAKLAEEEAELREAIASGDLAHIESELGDLLFTAVNIARWLKIDPEEALRKMLARFVDRFRAMELASPRPLQELSADEWDQLWNEVKARPRTS